MNKNPSEDVEAIIICEKMGWTYQEYLAQPDWFLFGIVRLESARKKQGELPLSMKDVPDTTP